MTVRVVDVARAAQVAPSTVSKVLNKRQTAVSVSEATRERILRAAREMNYRPNPIAQSLRTNRTATIGVVVNSPENNWQLLSAAEWFASERGFNLLVTVSRWDTRREEDEIRRMLYRQADGILVLSPTVEPGSHALIESLVREDFPLVGVGPMVTGGADFVDWDRAGVFRELTEHLISQGCRRFAYAGTLDTPGVRKRIEGIAAALETAPDAGFIRVDPQRLGPQVSLGGAEAFLRAFLKTEGPDAVICQSDDLALAAMKAAQGIGLVVPEDIAVTGAGDSRWGAILDIPLTTLRIFPERMAELAMARLIDRIEAPEQTRGPCTELVPAELVIRRSSLFRAGGGKRE